MRLFELTEAAIKLGSSKKDTKTDEFMETYFKVTQVHPFDDAARIAWDGKSTATIRPWGDRIHIEAIQTLAPGERSGSANGMIMTLVKIADETGVTLELNAKPFGTTEGKLTKRQLIAWYKRRGFVLVGGAEMEYVPQQINESVNKPYQVVDAPTVKLNGKTFVKHRVERNDPLVLLSADFLNQNWTGEMIIGPAPEYKNQISDRIETFKKFFAENDNIEMANVHVRENGAVSFGDGRHRTRVMLELGFKQIPVTMSKEALRNLRKFTR